MTNLFRIFTILFLSLFIFACSEDDEESNVVGGETNIPLNEVGNTFSASLNVGGVSYDIDESITVEKNDAGFVTLDVEADLRNIPALAAINDLIPSHLKDSDGKIKTKALMKITSDGIQDFFNKDSKPHTMVKYDCGVGDTYKIEKSDGKTITRSVTAKSDKDDFYWNGYLIKTITVVQDSRIPGISKFTYRFNHKFGLVYFETVMEDGSVVGSRIVSQRF